MPDLSKIPYYDLRHEHRSGRLPKTVARAEAEARLSRIISRATSHHAFVVGPAGCGKTSFLYSWTATLSQHPLLRKSKAALLDTEFLQKLSLANPAQLAFYSEAFGRLSDTAVVIDNFGDLWMRQPQALANWQLLLAPALKNPSVRFVFTVTKPQLDWLEENKSPLARCGEAMELGPLEDEQLLDILKLKTQSLPAASAVTATPQALTSIIAFCRRFESLGQLPKSATLLLDECLSQCLLEHNRQDNLGTKEPLTLSPATTEKIVSEKTGVPLSKLTQSEREQLKNLENILNQNVIGQHAALGRIASVIQRARLGLRSQNRPLGSFLMLGPSGVGKTETAKILADQLYGHDKSFVRIDMSEFGQEHTVARLIGSPAGYVGYEAGGQLTNHFLSRPYSLMLLDEIEKAHPKVFDIFLQLLDDGRLTSASGQTVNFSQAVVMATSNLGVNEILAGFASEEDIGSENFIRDILLPALLKHFRAEFLNRFDAIVVYKPLLMEDLVDIALLEIRKIEQRVKQHRITFAITPQVLEQKIKTLYDPRFGARPIKRFVEETCENLITQQLLK